MEVCLRETRVKHQDKCFIPANISDVIPAMQTSTTFDAQGFPMVARANRRGLCHRFGTLLPERH